MGEDQNPGSASFYRLHQVSARTRTQTPQEKTKCLKFLRKLLQDQGKTLAFQMTSKDRTDHNNIVTQYCMCLAYLGGSVKDFKQPWQYI